MRELKSIVSHTIKQYNMIEYGDLVIAGVSGGPDSITLLHLLRQLQDEIGFKLHVAHLDHSFRGREAEEEALWVDNTAKSWGLTCTLGKIDVPALAKKKGMSSQDAGHEARTGFFLELREALSAQKIALGHHADDQAETVLMHLLSGAGSEGLRGILPVKGLFIRPLLFVCRDEIEKYCRDHQLDPRRDPSNEKDTYLRNRIRNQLMPWLKENINPNLVETLGRTAQIFSAEEEYLQEITERAAHQCITKEAGQVRLHLDSFIVEPLAIQRRIIRAAYQLLEPKQSLPFKHVEKVIELILDKHVGKILHLPKEVNVEKEYTALLFNIGQPFDSGKKIERQNLSVPGSTYIPETGQVIETAVTEHFPEITCKNEVYLPWEEYFPPLYARSRMEGDRFSPRGLSGSKKLKDYFIDKKIPQKKRDCILLIADGKEVLWIPGISASSRLNKNSRCGKYVVFKVSNLNE